MGRDLLNSVSLTNVISADLADNFAEHTLLVTEDGVEVLTARLPDSPGGPIAEPIAANGNGAIEEKPTA